MQEGDGMRLLESFLNEPIAHADGIFKRFSTIPGAVSGCGEEPLQRFVYIPGQRKDRALLVSHADTVWDNAYTQRHKLPPAQREQKVILRDGVFLGTNPECGIGADDRAGCALLWALRDSGHSLLLVDGEEHEKSGAKYLRENYQKLYRELNRHQFMMELDWRNYGKALYNQVDDTKRFKRYIQEKLGYPEEIAKGGCDLQILCKRICGVNVSAGYEYYHTSRERIKFSAWLKTYEDLSGFLKNPQPRYRVGLKVTLREGYITARHAANIILVEWLHIQFHRKKDSSGVHE